MYTRFDRKHGQGAHVGCRLPHITMQDVVVSTARREHIAVPGHGAHPTQVAAHGAELPTLAAVPDLHLPVVGAYSQVRPSLSPAHTGHGVILPQVAELPESLNVHIFYDLQNIGKMRDKWRDSASGRTPKIHTVAEPNLGASSDRSSFELQRARCSETNPPNSSPE